MSGVAYQSQDLLIASTSINPLPPSECPSGSTRRGGFGLASQIRIRICLLSDSSHSRTGKIESSDRDAASALVISSDTTSSVLSLSPNTPHSHSRCLVCSRAHERAVGSAPSASELRSGHSRAVMWYWGGTGTSQRESAGGWGMVLPVRGDEMVAESCRVVRGHGTSGVKQLTGIVVAAVIWQAVQTCAIGIRSICLVIVTTSRFMRWLPRWSVKGACAWCGTPMHAKGDHLCVPCIVAGADGPPEVRLACQGSRQLLKAQNGRRCRFVTAGADHAWPPITPDYCAPRARVSRETFS